MRIRIVDAFTDRPFAGNPAGVVILDGDAFPADDWMQRVAAEVNLSETAFAHRLADGAGAGWALRWFTPTTEVKLCGHATLATAHVLRTTGADTSAGSGSGSGSGSGTIGFSTLSGLLTATADDSGAITLDFPTAPLTPVEIPEGLEEALGARPLRAYDTGEYIGDLLVELADERTVRELDPDMAAVGRLDWRGVIVTAAAEDASRGHDFVSRFFGSGCGIGEDPVTGSAHTALAPLWSERLRRSELTGLQVSARTGYVATALRGERTRLTGRAVTVIEGELLVAP
ncbi:PhzF family phenazine biosynthesis protein [Streptomyces sp. URMC 123]|uniref:PhzF family phenazine biosynthesis protein n=1 Tax=Streptomyces sp. URMC 123 TaxID=3423403 RepID=UPI003F1D8516